jgi:hypothetical protein
MTQPNAISDLEYALSVVARAVGSVPPERAAGHEEAVAWIQDCDSLPDAILVRFIRDVERETTPDSDIIRDFQLAAACALLDRATRRPSVRA